MPFSSSGSRVSERSQPRSGHVSVGVPNSDAQRPVAACGSSSGGLASLARNTGSVK